MVGADGFQTPRGGFFAVRYILCAMLSLSALLVYAMRVNLSISIVAMLNETTSAGDVPSDEESCRATVVPQNVTMSNFGPGEFHWSPNEQAMILYAFFIGYLISQIPGGFLAQRYSATWVLAIGVGLTGLFTSLTSIAARHSLYAFIVLRMLGGLCEGGVFPAAFVFISHWVPVQEQSFFINVIMSGSLVGAIVAMPSSALLCQSHLGWPASFYIFGITGIVWAVVWLLIAADTPEQHRRISRRELDHIIQYRPPPAKHSTEPVPWKRMLFSPAVLLLGVMNFGGALNGYMMLTELPSYLYFMYGIKIDDNGWINGGMMLGIAISNVATAALVDRLIMYKVSSRNFTRKFFVGFSMLMSAACLGIIAVIGCNYQLVLIILLINCIFIGLRGGSGNSITLDLAPKYAGTVEGIVNLIGSAAGVVAPLLVGQMTDEHNTLTQWNLVFMVTAVITTVCTGLFLIFGSTDEQAWNLGRPKV